MTEESYLELLDYRRRVSTLYADVRGLLADDPSAAHSAWRTGRDELFGTHPQSALPARARSQFTGLAYAEYDPALPFRASVRPPPRERFHVRPSLGHGIPLVPFGARVPPVVMEHLDISDPFISAQNFNPLHKHIQT